MQVFRLKSDVNHYQYFLTEERTLGEQLLTDCSRREDTWVPPKVFIYMPLLRKGDLFNFSGGSLIFSPSATEKLRMHLEMAGELLPLPYQGETHTLLNVTECINCLDQEKTEWVTAPDGTRLWPGRYVFHPGRLSESDIFKIPETYRAEVLVVDRDDDEGFVAALKEHDIQGYILELLWSG